MKKVTRRWSSSTASFETCSVFCLQGRVFSVSVRSARESFGLPCPAALFYARIEGGKINEKVSYALACKVV